MPRPRIGALPMTSAQRQARRRARLGRERPLSAPPARRPLPRPQRWAAVATLTALQDEISRLARQPASQPRRVEVGGELARRYRSRPRGAASIDSPRLWPRLTQEAHHPYHPSTMGAPKVLVRGFPYALATFSARTAPRSRAETTSSFRLGYLQARRAEWHRTAMNASE